MKNKVCMDINKSQEIKVAMKMFPLFFRNTKEGFRPFSDIA